MVQRGTVCYLCYCRMERCQKLWKLALPQCCGIWNYITGILNWIQQLLVSWIQRSVVLLGLFITMLGWFSDCSVIKKMAKKIKIWHNDNICAFVWTDLWRRLENVRCEGFKSKAHFCQVYIANALLVLPHGLDILDCHIYIITYKWLHFLCCSWVWMTIN